MFIFCRPSKAIIQKFNPLGQDSTHFRVNSFSVDENLLLIGESFRQVKNLIKLNTKI